MMAPRLENGIKLISKIKELSKLSRFRLSLPFISYEVSIGDLIDQSSVDERISKLGQIKHDLEVAISAIDEIRIEAEKRKNEAEQLAISVEQLNKEKVTAEQLLRVPEDAFTRLINRANSRGRVRGIVEGAIIGFVTGALSSYLVWYLTKQ